MKQKLDNLLETNDLHEQYKGSLVLIDRTVLVIHYFF